jgi:hypothetical protein
VNTDVCRSLSTSRERTTEKSGRVAKEKREKTTTNVYICVAGLLLLLQLLQHLLCRMHKPQSNPHQHSVGHQHPPRRLRVSTTDHHRTNVLLNSGVNVVVVHLVGLGAVAEVAVGAKGEPRKMKTSKRKCTTRTAALSHLCQPPEPPHRALDPCSPYLPQLACL